MKAVLVIDMPDEVLEKQMQESSENCISRQVAIDARCNR